MHETHSHGPARDPCCEGAPECAISRNRYFAGKQLTPASFEREQDYHVRHRRLLNRAIHGWGVVYGLGVEEVEIVCCEQKHHVLRVGAGLALDRAGRELVLVEPRDLRFADLHVIGPGPGATPLPHPPHPPQPLQPPQIPNRPKRPDDPGDPIPVERDPAAINLGSASPPHALEADAGKEICWLLSAHYGERRIDHVPVHDPCACERLEWDRVCEEVVFTLRRIDCEHCCIDDRCGLCCECMGECRLPLTPHNRGPHRCLCHQLTGLKVDPATQTLCRLDDTLAYDRANGVALACVALRPDKCGGWEVGCVIDACGPRRLVKRNDLLFDLIRGCDLTVIDDVSWRQWHRLVGDEHHPPKVTSQDFARLLSPTDDPPDECVSGVSVHFSRQVRKDSVRTDCFVIRAIAAQERTGWGEELRVPIVGVEFDTKDNDPFAHKATLVIDGAWWKDELRPDDQPDPSSRAKGRPWSVFRDEWVDIEIEVRGDFIIDCNGQAVDADPVGLRAVPSGNGTPGGTYRSTFTVAPAAATK